MFFFDVETVSLSSETVILSFACLHLTQEEVESRITYSNMLAKTFFVKLDVGEQVSQYKRKIDKGTLDWWDRQAQIVKRKSLISDPNLDVKAKDALDKFRVWVKNQPNHSSSLVWARGSLDQLCFESLHRDLDMKPPFKYNMWRDVRTAIDFLYPESKDGYVSVPGFDDVNVIKHDPIHDVCYDAMMILYGGSAD